MKATTTKRSKQAKKMKPTAIVEGKRVTIGDCVFFKDDIEQPGQIVDIETNWAGDLALILKPLGGGYFNGQHIGHLKQTRMLAKDCLSF